ncbi:MULTISPECIES: hypothetical protein [unclassified Microbacterium]|uniref:hypothetical protein n=1 Tax=unclassified Microbacterium TaxID=2609290 RepID=UPI00301B4810
MSIQHKYTPGPVVTVSALKVGDTVFLRQRTVGPGLPEPIDPATVTAVTPVPGERVRVHVRRANSGPSIEPTSLGDLATTREFRSAVASV